MGGVKVDRNCASSWIARNDALGVRWISVLDLHWAEIASSILMAPDLVFIFDPRPEELDHPPGCRVGLIWLNRGHCNCPCYRRPALHSQGFAAVAQPVKPSADADQEQEESVHVFQAVVKNSRISSPNKRSLRREPCVYGDSQPTKHSPNGSRADHPAIGVGGRYRFGACARTQCARETASPSTRSLKNRF